MTKQRRGRVLIVDNEPAVVRAVARRLEQDGYDCLTAIRGMEAMAHCTLNEVDLIITDLHMPGLDGEGFVNLVRSVSDVPIIVITGCDPAHRADLMHVGDLDVLAKPFEFAALHAMVERRLNPVEGEVHVR